MRPAAPLVALVAAALAAGACSSGGASSARPSSSPRPSASVTSGAPSPTATPSDPPVSQVVPAIEAFVARERKLAFKRPVKVTLLPGSRFVAKLREVNARDSDAQDVARARASLAAVQLLPAGTDLKKAIDATLDAGVLGFYDDRTKQLYVRGATASPGVRAVLAHELTHALQDQWFGLDRPALDNADDERSAGFTALVEGDAERVRKAYEASLPLADRLAAELEENSGDVPDVPLVVLQLIGLPYVVGPDFVASLVTHGGLPALDRAFRDPPVSSEQLIDPQRYLDGDRPRPVAAPSADRPVVDHGVLGEVGLLLMLQKYLPQATSRQAVEGWGGDRYVAWATGPQRWCLRDRLVMDSPEGLARITTALRQWAAKARGRPDVERESDAVVLTTCSS